MTGNIQQTLLCVSIAFLGMLWCSSPFVKIHTTLQVILTGAETELKSVNQKNGVDCWIRLVFKYKANVTDKWEMTYTMTFNTWVIYRDIMEYLWRGWKHKVYLIGMPFRASLSPSDENKATWLAHVHRAKESKQVNFFFFWISQVNVCLHGYFPLDLILMSERRRFCSSVRNGDLNSWFLKYLNRFLKYYIRSTLYWIHGYTQT